MVQRLKRSLVGKVVKFDWRDSFQGDLQEAISDLDDDYVWSSVGMCIRETDLFITITSSTSKESGVELQVHSPFSIPWTQIIGRIKVIDDA